MTLSDPSFPFAQLMEFKLGETFGISASVDEDDTCYELDDAFIKCMILMTLSY